MKLVLRLLINAVALWLTTLIVGGVHVVPYGEAGTLETILTYLLVAAIFGIVNGIIGNLIRVVAFPIYILTLGLVALVVNGLMLLLASWLSTTIFGFGLEVDDFWSGVLGALVLGILSWLIGILLRPFVGSTKSRK